MIDTICEESYEDGNVIFEEGSSGDWIYYVESGAVELSRRVDGKKVVISVLRKGEVFGELAFIGGYRRTATAIALGPTMLGVMDKEGLSQEYNRLSDSFRLLVRSLATRLKMTTDSCIGQIECRRDPRFEKCLALTFRDKNALRKAHSANVSGTGIFIKTPIPLEPGTVFPLSINVPDDENTISLEAEVMWVRKETDNEEVRPVGMGVRFVRITDEQKRRLEICIRS
ncbi:MAG: cyclic nucleotide-binding domain-containing protein [Thermodesulfobacteriota bacterium]